MRRFGVPCVFVVAATAAGCAGDGAGKRFEVGVAPLTLSDVTGASYDITVYNSGIGGIASADVVWSQAGITSTQYGDGKGSITYIGPCDADTPAGAPNLNTVELVTTSFTSADPADTFQLPCPDTRPCLLERPCDENADVLVEFNLTVMRNAKQGFFDVAVNFDDIFCSAKVDCLEAGLLHDVDGTREATVVYALACTGGPGAAASTLLFDDVVIGCDDGDANATVVTEPTQDGNQLSALDAQDAAVSVYQVGIYQGEEDLSCGLASCQKVYSNTAIGIGAAALGTTCRLTTKATAGTGIGRVLPGNASYPIIAVDVQITDGSGALSCGNNPLNGGDAQAATGCFATPPVGVCTSYTDVSNPVGVVFAHDYEVGGAVVPSDSACTFPESEHPNYTTPARDVALCGAMYDTTNIDEACAAGWHVCTLPEWQSRYPAGVYPGGTVSSAGADQLVRCEANQWEANQPYDGDLWDSSMCPGETEEASLAYNPWNTTKNLYDADGTTILEGSGNCCDWDATFGARSGDEGFAVYCCAD